MGKIFVFMGKSSSGKDTIYKAVSVDFKDIKEIVPYTTRPIREGEIDGVTYHYVNDEMLEQMKKENLIIESRAYNTMHGVWTYFNVSSAIDLDNNNYMTINTLVGYEKFKEYYGEDKVVPIYIQVKDDGVRLQRALNREMKEKNPKYEEMCRRFLSDQINFSEENLIKANVETRFDNDDLNACILEIETKIRQTLEKENKQKQLRK